MSQKCHIGNIYQHGVGAAVEGMRFCEEVRAVVEASVSSILNLV